MNVAAGAADASRAITSGLWLLARAQYSQHLRACSPPDGTWVGWSDYTPFSLVIAGMLNIPIATFAAPLYHLMQNPAKAELTALLLGVAVLWGYIGWTMDKRNHAPTTKRMLRGVVGSFGVLFGLLVLVVSVPMFHVGVLYRAAALVWCFCICRHFVISCVSFVLRLLLPASRYYEEHFRFPENPGAISRGVADRGAKCDHFCG